ncbi:MAG: TatD family hydrolase [Candidatus Paceibacterota bacterium]
MIDTHAHLDFPDFDSDREELIKKCFDLGIKIINPGTNFDTSERAVKLAGNYENIYAAVGLHPGNIETQFSNFEGERLEKDFDYGIYKKLINEKTVAIGEIGLDFWRMPKEKENQEILIKKQQEIFIKQLDLADEFNLPIIIHCRAAMDELTDILEKRKTKGVVHCFTGNWEQAQKFIAMGYFIGLNGIMFKMNLKEVVKNCPLQKILLETDCPFLPPTGFEKRNNPLSLTIIAETIAKLKGVSAEEVVAATDNNAIQLFNLK